MGKNKVLIMEAIIIARVSTEEQKDAGNSLPAQIARLEGYCQKKGYEIIKKFSFDESAYKDQREDFDEILDFVIGQKEKMVVCFDKVDRLSRNVFDVRVATLYEKALRDEVELHFPSDGQVINSQISAVEKFQFGISLGLAKYFSDAISDNVKRAQEQMLRSGQWIGKAPYGYKNITLENEKKDIVPDEFESKIVLKMYEWYSSGAFSMRLIREKLKADYNLNFSNSYVDFILKQPFYYGEMLSKGKLYSHKYQTIISKELFDKVQQIKAGYNKKHFKFAGLPYMYRGLIRCADCGCMITPEKAKDKYVYYHCTQYKGKHNAEWLREEDITEQFGKLFKKLQLPEGVVDETIETLRNVHLGKSEFREEQVKKLSEEKEKYAKRIEEMYLDRLDGRITADGYDKMYKAFKLKIDEIDTKLFNLQKAEDDYYLTSEYILRLLQNAYNLFVSSEIEEKRQLLKLILQNSVLDGRLVKYSLLKPFDAILNYTDNPTGLRS
ncbi:MAG: Resolvase [Candidatus Levybacteria bacterium GW2011_GWC1_40_19]|nr:MAG: Resolvase [Candidatus Levybacteria bacterium GW2011_GWA1_39_32]KKR51503.1 MAG: Resolvase [Candidatus Levybacteria bacterium GW2011_GWC1_40_19]KKS01917.1 MAG: Resolvase [Candidatus Levybacteria bacterium GW2011_GWB1_41_21]OGH52386.1 MAG: hypothetical protein A3H20_00795 [Candidatus Levybacteria bacterium RIFCSPLOWO2_12_FULL_41_12]OGH53486.1 MAG: hypothetical protein A2423_04020 [Candidatus Levybacteria bacterium RIFOXYC1_FULL_40_10]OGH54730.1 MAG: hypothetical protein A2596_03730 [Candi